MSAESDSTLKPITTEQQLEFVNLKNQLKLFLDLRRLTPSQLARKANVSRQLISQWTAGSNGPKDLNKLKRVADALETSLDQLVFGKGETRLQVIPPIAVSEAINKEGWISGIFEIKMRKIDK